MERQTAFYIAIVAIVAIFALGISVLSYLTVDKIPKSTLNIDDVSKSISDNLLSVISPKLDTINQKADQINSTLSLSSEDHYIKVMNTLDSSVVEVLGAPLVGEGDSLTSVYYVDTQGNKRKMGAGFSINKKGEILTAAHIITNDGKQFLADIKFKNGSIMHVSTVNSYPNADLAVLHVESGLPPVDIIDSGSLSSGSTIGFIGFPLGDNSTTDVTRTKTMGVISAETQSSYSDGPSLPIYVINSFVNHGNSGGPLFSMKSGKVVGLINQRSEGQLVGFGFSTQITRQLLISNGISLD